LFEDLASSRTHCLFPLDPHFLARSTLPRRDLEIFYCFLTKSADKRGADVDFQAIWARVSNQKLQVSPRGVSDWWRRDGPQVSLALPEQSSGISNNNTIPSPASSWCAAHALSRNARAVSAGYTSIGVRPTATAPRRGAPPPGGPPMRRRTPTGLTCPLRATPVGRARRPKAAHGQAAARSTTSPPGRGTRMTQKREKNFTSRYSHCSLM